jgi:hypothetical protein
MPRISGKTQRTLPASRIDLADNALSDERTINRIFNHADKLVPERALETGISASDLEIGVANTRFQHADQRLAVSDRSPNLFDGQSAAG